MSVRDFYDGLASEYHLVYQDWYAEVERQGAALDRLIRGIHKNPADVLDCSCGIGPQAIGLARLGYRVQGTDISERSLERARVEAARLGVDIAFAACDFRTSNRLRGRSILLSLVTTRSPTSSPMRTSRGRFGQCVRNCAPAGYC